jgi:hypothetical protein
VGCGLDLGSADALGGPTGPTGPGQGGPGGPPPGGPPPGPGGWPPPGPGGPGAPPPDPYGPPGGPGAPPPDPYGPPGGGYPPPPDGPGGPPPDPYGPPGGPGGYPPPPGGPGGYPPPPGGPGAPGAYAPPPGGPPPGWGGPGGYPPGGPPEKKRRGALLIVLGVIVVAALAVAAFFVFKPKDEEAKVVLEPVGMVQEDDFAGNLDVGEAAGAATAAVASLTTPDVPDPRAEQVGATLSGRVVQGSDEAVYGGSRDTQVCDTAKLVSFLTDPANEAKAEAWAGVLGVDVAGIPDYVAGLTAVRLRFDTRVTNHGFKDGEANAFQSLLQAGTAVLVDDTGVPRVKCNCGNPLAEPTALGDEGSSSDAGTVENTADNPDEAWDGLDPTQAVTVQAGDQVDAITLVDFDSGGLIQRPIGSDGVTKTDVGTGDVQLTLQWASDADLDLHVIEPDGTEIDYINIGPTSTGGQLDVDSNVDCENDGGVENIFWPVGAAPSGSYTVRVNGFRLSRDDGSDCGAGDFTLKITVAGEVRTETGTVGQDENAEYTFDVT